MTPWPFKETSVFFVLALCAFSLPLSPLLISPLILLSRNGVENYMAEDIEKFEVETPEFGGTLQAFVSSEMQELGSSVERVSTCGVLRKL